MASPMPLPRARVVKNGSKIRARMCAGTPGPLSLTTICARPPAVRRASNSRSRSAVAACSALVAKFRTADTSAAGPAAVADRHIVIHQLVELLEAADRLLGASREVRRRAPGQCHLRGV